MKTIPEVREDLLDIASYLISGDNTAPGTKSMGRKIKTLVKAMYRRSPVRRAHREHAVFTPELAVKIRRAAQLNPHASYAKLGRVFNVATGRVSEAIAGKRAA